MRIAMIGQRGVPATFGGVERHVEELGARLVERGHEVVVYNRPNYAASEISEYRGMRVVTVPTIENKHLEALVHSARCSWRATRGKFDIVHFHAIGPGLAAALPRVASSARGVQTIHGLDHQRAKWGRLSQAMLGVAAWSSGHVPDATVVVSRALGEWYAEQYGRPTTYIPNGVNVPTLQPRGAALERLGVGDRPYVLSVGRLVPEKDPESLIEAWRSFDSDAMLVIAGGSSFTDDYVAHLEDLARRDPRIVLAGYVYGDELAELYTNAAVFVLPSLLEGLPLTLLEAVSYGLPIVASSIPPHVEVIGDSPGGRLFPAGDRAALVDALDAALLDREARHDAATLRSAVLAHYDWDHATDLLEALYRG